MADVEHLPLAALLRSRRAALGWSQAEIATRAKLSIGSVSNYEAGRRSPDARSLARLMVALHISASTLYDSMLVEAGEARPLSVD